MHDLKDLQNLPQFRDKWIEYSAKDAAATWYVRKMLEKELNAMPWMVDNRKMGTMLEFYSEYFIDFGEVLTDMERNGIRIDTQKHLKEAEARLVLSSPLPLLLLSLLLLLLSLLFYQGKRGSRKNGSIISSMGIKIF